jgi:hypothetical protein
MKLVTLIALLACRPDSQLIDQRLRQVLVAISTRGSDIAGGIQVEAAMRVASTETARVNVAPKWWDLHLLAIVARPIDGRAVGNRPTAWSLSNWVVTPFRDGDDSFRRLVGPITVAGDGGREEPHHPRPCRPPS